MTESDDADEFDPPSVQERMTADDETAEEADETADDDDELARPSRGAFGLVLAATIVQASVLGATVASSDAWWVVGWHSTWVLLLYLLLMSSYGRPQET